MDDETKDVVLEAIRCQAQLSEDGPMTIHYPGVATVRTIYEGTPWGSPARALMVELFTDHDSDVFPEPDFQDLPKEFLADLAMSLMLKRPIRYKLEYCKLEWDITLQELEDEKEDFKETVEELKNEITVLQAKLDKAQRENAQQKNGLRGSRNVYAMLGSKVD